MANWRAVGMDMGTGAVFGVVDQVVKKMDTDRATKQAVPQIAWTKRYGTYFNYGVPILTIGAIAMNKLSGLWATRLAVVGGQLAGREVTNAVVNKMATNAGKAPVYYKPAPQYVPAPNPQVINLAQAVPVVTPQRNLGVQGLTG